MTAGRINEGEVRWRPEGGLGVPLRLEKMANEVTYTRLRAALTSSDPAKAFNPFSYTFKLVAQPGNTANPYLLMVDKRLKELGTR